MLLRLVLAAILATVVSGNLRNLAADTCTASDNEVTIQPDAEAMLIGLFDMRLPMHNGVGCGQPDEVMMPAYEAVKWTLNRLNTNNGQIDGITVTDSYVPGIRIGMKLFDTCGSSKVATEKLISSFENYYVPEKFCQDDAKLKLGVIGASRSVVSQEVASWLGRLKGPMVSFSSGVTSLGQTSDFPFFMRTVPPSSLQAQVIVEVLQKLGWSKISVVYSNDAATREDYEQTLRAANRNGICVTQALAAQPFMSSTERARLLTKLTAADTHGVLYIGDRDAAYEVLHAINTNTVTGADELQWVFAGQISPDKDFIVKHPKRLRGFVGISPKSEMTTEFRDYWTDINERNAVQDNPWYQEWYMKVHNCKLTGVNYEPYASMPSCQLQTTQQKRANYVQNQYVAAAIDSVMAYATALKNAQAAVCFGQRGVCAALKSMSTDDFYNNYMLKVQLTYSNNERIPSWAQRNRKLEFDPSGELLTSTYDVWNLNNKAGDYSIVNVGSYAGRLLTLDPASVVMYNGPREVVLPNLPTYGCAPSGCGICLDVRDTEELIRIDGDVLINTIMSVHHPASGRCGNIEPKNAQNAQAFIYAIENVQSKLNILSGIDLGAIGYDDCGVPTKAINFIEAFDSGLLNLKSGAGNPYTAQDVPVYVATCSDEITMRVADLLTRLKVPQISFGATTTELSNLNRYPYFMRTIPSNGKLANAMIQILKRMDWSYVQLVNSPDIHGRSGKKDFIQQAAANGICVTAAYEFETSGTPGEIVAKLKQRTEAKVVIVFANREEHVALLDAIQTSGEAGNFLIVADSNWGADVSTAAGATGAARNAITVDLEESALTDFQNYLSGLDVRTYKTNPWFRGWYESVYNCYLDANSMPMYSSACTDQSRPITSATGFKPDPATIHMINAVYTSAIGIHQALQKVCGVGYRGVCNEFTQMANRADLIVEEMEKASFTDATNNLFQLSRREGNANLNVYQYQQATSPQVIASFSTASGTMAVTGTISAGAITSACTGAEVCNICLQKLNKVLFIPGDVYLAGLFDIHKTGDSVYTCGSTKTLRGFQQSEAFAYAIDQINSGQAPVKLNNVQLGGVGFDDCSSGFQAANLVSNVYSGSMVLGKDGEVAQPDMIKAWISYGNTETVAVADELTKRQVPLISPDASTTMLDDVSKYPTVYRTVPTDHILTQSMVRFIFAMDWGCVQIVYSPNVYGRTGYRTFRQNAKLAKLCVTQCLELESHGTYDEVIQDLTNSPTKAVVVIAEADYVMKLLEAKANANDNQLIFIGTSTWGDSKNVVRNHPAAARRSLTINVNSPVVQGFTSYLEQSTRYAEDARNPWLTAYYQALLGCDLPGNSVYGTQCSSPQTTPITTSQSFEQETWTVSTIDAVYAAAQSIHFTLQSICGENYSGICPQYLATDVSEKILGNLGNVDFESVRGEPFRFNTRSGGVGFDIFQFVGQNQYKQIGTTMGLHPDIANLDDLRDEYSTTPTTCTPCEECKLDIELNEAEKFIYIPGDVLIGGMFDVHKRGLFPFTCDPNIRRDYSFQLVEAFAYAIEQVNSKQGIFSDKLRGLTLGGVGLDSCESAIRAGNLISDFHSGVIELTKNGETVDPNKVKVYIGGMETDRSMQMADVLEELGLPQISYGAAGGGLHNRDKYPLFSRTIPANRKQVTGMIKFLKRYHIDSVQLVNSPGPYGEDGAREFMRVAEEEKVCVSQNITFRDNGTVTVQSAYEVVNLLLNRPNSTVVVVFLETDYINKFLHAVQYNKKANGKFRFFGSESWGKNVHVYEGAESQVQDTVVFNVDTGNVPGYDDYLSSKLPNTYVRNPWFNTFYQEVYQCTLPGSTLNFPNPCAVIDRSIVNQDYEQESYVMYVVQAVYTAAIGLDTTLRNICGQNYTGICDEWRSSMNPETNLLEGIREASFFDPANGKEFKFVDDGESIRGFEIYALEKYPAPGAVLEYNLIGRYEHISDDELELRTAPSFRFNHISNCDFKQSCDMCPYMEIKPSRYMKITSPNYLNIVGFFGVHETGSNYLTCGKLDMDHGFLATLAFFYGINLVNNDASIANNIQLGGLAIDYCHSVNRIRMDLYSFLDQDGLCIDASKDELVPPSTVVTYITNGSDASIAAASMLSPRKLTSMSQSMVEPTSTKSEYPYLLRTLPNCGRQGAAIFDVLFSSGWSYFNAVYSNDACGLASLEQLNIETRRNGYCLGKSHMLTMEADIERAKAIVRLLVDNPHGNAIVLLTTKEHTTMMLQAISILGLKGRFVLLGTDAWGTDHEVVKGVEHIAEGSITIELPKHRVPGFVDWMTTMSETNHLGLPEDWFHEFWQHTHKCYIESARIRLMHYGRPCSMSETITPEMIKDDDEILNTILATYVIGRGLANAQNSAQCGGASLSACLSTISEEQKKEILFNGLLEQTSFNVLNDQSQIGNKTFQFHFTDENDAQASYIVYHYNKIGDKYYYRKIGACAGQCLIPEGAYTSNKISECPTDDVACQCESSVGPIYIPPAPEIEAQFTEIFGIIITILNLLGMLISFILFFHFCCFYPNRGGSTVLGYMALFGVFILFAFNFAYIFYPHPIVCAVRRFCQGVIYALIFGALAVKCMCTWKNTELFEYDFVVTSKKRYTHPFGLFIITLCFVAVQVMIATQWLILEPPMSEEIVHHGRYWARCTPHDFYNQGLVLSLIYVMFLMFLTLGFSGFSWPSDENNYEARYILGSTVFCMGTWMVWCIVSTMTDIVYRDGATAIGNLFCGYGLLFFVFFRKCYLLQKFRRNKFAKKRGKDKTDGPFDNLAAQKDDDQLSDKSSGHGSL